MNNPLRNIVVTDKDTGKFLQLTKVNGCPVDSSWKNITDTAKIILPRNIKALNGSINDILKRGSQISIQFGYDDGLPMQTEFTGYIARVNAKVPVTIECEDEMWNLKQTSFTNTFKKIKLLDLINYIYPGQKSVIDMDLPSYRIDRASAAAVLASLKEQYGIISYFQNGKLYVGFAYNLALKRTVIFHLQQNVPREGVDLQYRLADDVKVMIKGVSIQPGGKKIEYSKGDKDGDVVNLQPDYNLSSQTLQTVVDETYNKYKIAGYKGTIKAFGKPFCQHGDIAHIIDSDYPDREGYYYIDKVEPSNDVNGFFRTVTLGRLVSL